MRSSERALTAGEQAQLDSWLAADSRNLGAYIRARAIWIDADRVAALDDSVRAEPSRPRQGPRWRHYAMAASFVVALLGGGFAYDRLPGRVTTDRAEIREVALADGSTAMLNGASTAQIRYREGERKIVMRGGEASFRVAHDATRPFVVDAGDLRITAVGTEFAVSMRQDDVEVTVAEGVVSIARAGSAEPPRYVRRNEQFVSTSIGARRAQLEPEEVERQLAWRRGLLVFSGQSLGRAVAEVNRYSDISVVIDDPTLARAEFVGVFRIGDGRAFADAAARAFNGVVVERPDSLHLMRAQNSPSH